ncbi:MAG: hypothetical protein AAFN63_03735 [Pseudomonadota bacterium]
MRKKTNIQLALGGIKAAAACTLWSLGATQLVSADPMPTAPMDQGKIDFAAPDLCCLNYRIISMPLSDFLVLLSEDSGARLSQPDGLRGIISNTRLIGDVNTILNTLSAAHGLDWFAFNGVYHISSKADAVTRLVPLNDLSVTQARAALERSGLSLDGKYIDTAANETALAVYGGSSFVGIVEAILAVTPGTAEVQATESAIRIRRGSTSSIEYFGVVDPDLVEQLPAAPERDAQAPADPETDSELGNG